MIAMSSVLLTARPCRDSFSESRTNAAATSGSPKRVSLRSSDRPASADDRDQARGTVRISRDGGAIGRRLGDATGTSTSRATLLGIITATTVGTTLKWRHRAQSPQSSENGGQPSSSPQLAVGSSATTNVLSVIDASRAEAITIRSH
jgi:hypothetical protein